MADDASPAALALLRAAIASDGAAQRRFILLNRSRETWPYQIAVLWAADGLAGHSGAGEVEAQGPYAQWLARLREALRGRAAGPLTPDDLPGFAAGPDSAAGGLAREWHDWWPGHALWLPLDVAPGADTLRTPALMLVRELPWSAREVAQLADWYGAWQRLDDQLRRAATPRGWRQAWRTQPAVRRRLGLAALALGALMLLPVHLTVRAPGELVPRDPLVLRAGVDGLVRALKVEPNQVVKAGQVLAELDDAGWAARLQVAQHALRTAEAEWRQTSQQALNDAKAKAQLPAAQGKVEERRADVAFLEQQVQRSTLVAPHDGVVLIQDAGSWPGRTVTAGEAVMKLARPGDQEVEAWLAAGDAIDLADGAPMRLHLHSRPASPLPATLRLYAFEAEHRADLGLGYRLRGTLQGEPTQRLGARGTVRIDGPWVPLAYWVLRRPLAALREASGW